MVVLRISLISTTQPALNVCVLVHHLLLLEDISGAFFRNHIIQIGMPGRVKQRTYKDYYAGLQDHAAHNNQAANHTYTCNRRGLD